MQRNFSGRSNPFPVPAAASVNAGAANGSNRPRSTGSYNYSALQGQLHTLLLVRLSGNPLSNGGDNETWLAFAELAAPEPKVSLSAMPLLFTAVLVYLFAVRQGRAVAGS
jgi:hypothetical protein